jgi:hypothetical protein
MKTIIRVKRQQGGFTIIPNDVLRDKMSLRAKGLLCMILSNVDEWIVTKTWVAQHCTDGREALRASFDELVELGYASMEEQGKTDDGRFAQRIWTFTDQPHRVREVAENSPESAESRLREVAQNEPFCAGNRQRETVDGNPSPKNTIKEDHVRRSGGAAKERPRNALADALAEVCGMDLDCMTTGEWKRVAIALADIKKAQPNVTVSDIQAHAVNYRKVFKDATMTPMALSNHWGATAPRSGNGPRSAFQGANGVVTAEEFQNLKERLAGHVANPRHGDMFKDMITPSLQQEFDAMKEKYFQLKAALGGTK